MSEEEIIKGITNIIYTCNDAIEDKEWYDQEEIESAKEQLKFTEDLLDLYQKEKEKNKELEKQYKILEVEKVRYHIQYLESDISQTPDTAMVYHSMKKHLETLKEEKIKLEAELQELLEERN